MFQQIAKIGLKFLAIISISTGTLAQESSTVITSDIDRFWEAYDRITATKDSAEQYAILNELFIAKGSLGQLKMMEARRYTPESYINAINSYPKFWNSIRENTYRCKEVESDIEEGIKKLKALYPGLKPAKIYYTIGALRSPGTTTDGMVLIGTELAFANESTVTEELGENFSHLGPYFKTNPGKEIVFLNVHEYVHTQQKTTVGNSLLAQTIIEGVAEFVATQALQIESPNPQIKFGYANEPAIKNAFRKEIFSPYFHNWLWSNVENQFQMRDLAYYVGYAICEKYYNNAVDKKTAIKEMIQLDYNNADDLCTFVNQANYFDFSAEWYLQKFERERPYAVAVREFENGSANVDPTLTTITIEFSEQMDTNYTDFRCGPSGMENCLMGPGGKGFSKDGKSYHLNVTMKPETHYQLLLTQYFSNANGVALKPYLIEFTTGQ